MATLQVQRTWVTGEIVTAAYLNANVRDAINQLKNLDRCWVYNNANISIPNATATALTFNTESYDTNGMHSTVTNTSRITIQTDGAYQFSGHVSWSGNATGYREVKLVKNGASDIWLIRENNAGASITQHTELNSPPFNSSSGDYYELHVTQTSGGALLTGAAGIYGIAFAAMQVTG